MSPLYLLDEVFGRVGHGFYDGGAFKGGEFGGSIILRSNGRTICGIVLLCGHFLLFLLLLAIQLGCGRISGDVGGIKELVHGGDGGAYTIPNVVGFKKSLYVLQSKGAANATERNMATTTAFRLSGSASTSTSSSSIFFENVVVASWLGW